jgi:hypothetical protein
MEELHGKAAHPLRVYDQGHDVADVDSVRVLATQMPLCRQALWS